jgi:UDP-N-acetyl-D-glucosamine dehydrogenase
MPQFVVERVVSALSQNRKPLRDAKVHLFGIAYKPGVGDVRESPAIDIAGLLQRGGAIVSYSDPHVPAFEQGDLVLEQVSCESALERGFDCGVITTSHREFDYDQIAGRSACLVDTRNALKGFSGAHIHRL